MAKNYVKWSAKLIKTQYWEIMNISINVEDLWRLPQNKWYVKLTIAEKKEVDKYWNTHSIYENDYVGSWETTQPNNTNNTEEDLPF